MKILKKRILAYTLALAIILSSLVFGVSTVSAETAADYDVWDGTTAESFAGGDGSAATPYIIETPEQLHHMVVNYSTREASLNKYFKITNDIYLNSVADGKPVKNLADKKDWLKDYGTEDFPEATDLLSFCGTLDGDGHTIYGLYVQSAASAGLFPAFSSGVTVKNLSIENLYFADNNGEGYAGAFAGRLIYEDYRYKNYFTNCSVTGATIGSRQFIGGLVADTQSCNVTFTNCYSYNNNFTSATAPGGITGTVWNDGTPKIITSYSIGYFPVRADNNKTTGTNVYTNVAIPEGNTSTGIVPLTDDQMKGSAAKANMAGFDFFGTWQTVENGYPVIRDEILPVWDGTKDSNLEGNGTEAEPYLIKTPAQLAYIVTANNGGAFTGKYFKLANDIRINDTTNANWKDSARGWVWADFRFVGTFDGDGHTIDGLYYNGSQRVMGLFSYVGADNNGVYKTTLKNFKMTNAYIESTAADGAGFAAGQASRVAYFDGIYIDDTCEIKATCTGVGGILGQSSYNVFMSNIAMNGKVVGGSNVGAFAGTLSSGARLDIKSSYTTADLYAQGVTDRNLSTASGAVYVVKKQGTVDAAATLLTLDQMKGENAKTNMTGFSFKYVWETVDNDYPVYNPRGDLWDGSWVTDFSSFDGSGTAEDPYIIKNGAQLAYAVAKGSSVIAGAKHYKLANDIVLNDTSYDGWEAGAHGWYQDTSKRFNGVIDGDGHTIEGLYFNATSGGRYGLVAYSGKLDSGSTQVATFKNITFTGASINNSAATSGSAEGAAIVVGQASGETIFENIYIDETCKVNAPNVKGVAGLVGRGYNEKTYAHITITNCAVLANLTGGSHVGAFAGTFWDDYVVITASNSFADVNSGLIGSTDGSAVLNNVYSTTIGGEDADATQVAAEGMKGEAAKTNMSGLDFDFLWKTTTNGYPVLRPMDERLEGWDGSAATTLKGEGTKENPYKISNGAELYYAIVTYSNADVTVAPTEQKYFEITSDINLANQQWYVPGLTAWFNNTAYNNIGFNGIIYGNGHTIYKFNSNAASTAAGLIPVATQGTEIYDLHLVGGTLPRHNWLSYALGGFIGLAKGAAGSAPIIIDGCSVKNFDIAAVHGGGGFIGYSFSQSYNIKDSYVVNSTFVADADKVTAGTANASAFVGFIDGSEINNSFAIENCYTDTASAESAQIKESFSSAVSYKNVYTVNETESTTDGITNLTVDKITGAAAKTNMNGFNFNQKWQVADGAYPVHTAMDYRAKYWDGTVADAFAGGKGTEDDPYLISTADQLYLLANLDREATHGKFYKLTNNIAISNVYDGWANDDPYTWAEKKAYLDGFTYSSSFAGTLDGAGYTVSGIYYNNAITDGGTYAYGLIPFVTGDAVIKNIRVEDVNATVSGNAYVGAVAGAAHVTPEDADNPFKMVQFIAVSAADCDITAENAGDILGGATRGVKFELCNAAKLIGSGSEKIYTLGCNAGKPFNKDMIIYNSLNADVDAVTLIRKVILGLQTASIADINGVEGIDILDLVSASRNIGANENEEVLVWSQEFGGDAMDYSVWSKNTTMSKGTTLNYADNYAFDGENMKMYTTHTGAVDENGNKIYNVAYGLSTRDTMSFKYGRLEMRAKIPFGAGAFPSLWLTSRNAIGNGTINEFDTEIDIFEVFGKTAGVDNLVTCIHKWYNDEEGARTGHECSCGSGLLAGNGYKVEEADRDYQITGAAQNEFHTFVFDWTEDTMTFSVDGNVYYTAKRSDMNNFDINGYNTNSDGIFNQYLYLRLNNHMYTAGDGAAYTYQGNADDIDAAALNYEIDYIRLYQKANGEINLK
ncbi:MAG: glycoside hydrolase family 16 protein [Clostridia bacterium]|nr:glycoside hydrolase family 16 protein [Clostridia bacterium]